MILFASLVFAFIKPETRSDVKSQGDIKILTPIFLILKNMPELVENVQKSTPKQGFKALLKDIIEEKHDQTELIEKFMNQAKKTHIPMILPLSGIESYFKLVLFALISDELPVYERLPKYSPQLLQGCPLYNLLQFHSPLINTDRHMNMIFEQMYNLKRLERYRGPKFCTEQIKGKYWIIQDSRDTEIVLNEVKHEALFFIATNEVLRFPHFIKEYICYKKIGEKWSRISFDQPDQEIVDFQKKDKFLMGFYKKVEDKPEKKKHVGLIKRIAEKIKFFIEKRRIEIPVTSV